MEDNKRIDGIVAMLSGKSPKKKKRYIPDEEYEEKNGLQVNTGDEALEDQDDSSDDYEQDKSFEDDDNDSPPPPLKHDDDDLEDEEISTQNPPPVDDDDDEDKRMMARNDRPGLFKKTNREPSVSIEMKFGKRRHG